MPDLRFEWDGTKDAENQRKHGVSFEEAQTVFYDERGLFIDDPDSSARKADRAERADYERGWRG